MKRIVLALALAVVASACRGEDNSAPDTGSPEATVTVAEPGRLTEADVLAVVPPEWGLLDWAVAPDGAFAAVVTESPRANNIGTARVASVYAPSAHGPIEVARVSHMFGEIALDSSAGKTLAADQDGARFVDVTLKGETYVRVGLAASGEIALEYRQPLGDDEPTATFVPATDPLAQITVTATDGSSWVLPAGVVPAGWVVTGAGTSPDGRYVAVTTEPNANAFGGQFSVYRVDDDRLREEFRAANEYMSLHETLVFSDITGDGSLEVAYGDSFGGTGWTNHTTRAVTIAENAEQRTGAVQEIEFELPVAQSAPSSPEDLDGDGVYEWWAIDASWELAGFCHVCSPSSTFVLAWDGEKYADASVRFGDAIVERSGWEEWAEAPVTCLEQDSYLSSLIARFLTRYNAGRANEAEAILAQMRALTIDERLRAKRDRIVEVLETAPHAPFGVEWARCEDPADG